jgi:RHS repeat-associated protein
MFAPQSASPAQQSLIGADGVLLDPDPDPAPGSLATHFRNAVGNPRFTARSQASAAVPTSAQLGSYNYQFNVPVVSVGGRGESASIGMTLNSRVWNADNGKLTFNYVGAYPAPGWSMGYGKIIRNYNATATGDGSGIESGNSPGDYLLVTGDGTRIRLAAKYDNVSRWFHESDDGSFLRFNPISGEMLYPDGARMIYGSVNGVLLPTAMIGTNGGAITMTYRDYCEGACVRVFRHRTALSAVRDTMGRYVTFHYYGDNDYTADPAQGRPAGELAAIKAPDKDGLQQEIIRAHYQPITLKYDFGGIVVDAPANNSQIQVVRRVYYPQTGRGYLFLDYSTYGMPRKISSRMGMTGVGGAITDGTEIAYTTYNYTTMDPSDPYNRNQQGSLTDFPQFTRREEWWQGKTDPAGAPTTAPTRYDYSRVTNGSTEVTTMKYADKNCEEVTTTGTDSGQLSFGKVISVERKTSAPPQTTLAKQVMTYVTGPDGEVEVEKIETFDEAGQGTLVGFVYGSYGRVTNRHEYGYKQGGSYQIRRRALYEYVNAQGYLDARFLRLISRTSVYDAKNNDNPADDALMAKTETVYDGYTDPAVGGIENYGLTSGQYPPNHDATYDQNKTLRGNATSVTIFSKVAPEDEKSTTRRVKYDIFGNVVEAEVSCCVKKFFGFSALTYYSQPDWVRSGPDSEAELNLKATYRYNNFTGLVETETNPDGWDTTYEYDTALRLKRVITPTLAETLTQFERDGNGNDLLSYFGHTIYDDQGTQKVITGKQWFDGSGRVIRAGTGTGDAPDSYDTVATVYDGWGRVTKQSNPYAGDADGNPISGVTRFWTVSAYDELSRVVTVTLPGADNQTIRTVYSGATSTSGATIVVTDTVGRIRKTEVDGLGRLAKVIEQNPANGNLEWETSYSYDILNNLTQINQGGQLRTFAYDARSRLTRETTPESGQITYDYTDFDAVSKRTDARGVVTNYTYGDLNLLTGVSYDTSQATGVAPTAAVNITYKHASPGKGQIVTVTDGPGGDGESYTYDSFGRLQSCTQKIDGMSYQKQYEYNEANQVTLMIYPSGKRVNVWRDDRGRLSAVKRVDTSGALLDTYLSGINYRADGQISSQNLGDSTTESFEYSDDRLQLTKQKVMKGDSTLLDLSYGYGALAGQMGNGSAAGNSGQLVSVTGTINGQARNQAFTYDNVGRLVTATGWGAWARRHDYDRYGNRTAVWDAVSGGNQLQNTVIGQAGGMKTNRIASVNGTAFSYDAGGNVTGDGARAYIYDSENRVVSVSGLSSESYSYDAWNRRVKKVAGGVVTHYIWEGNNQVIGEYERGGGATQATGKRYYHQDRLSTRIITNGAGAVVGTTDHLPFGESAGVSGEEEKHKFTTYERDSAGHDYALNRFYSSQQGRFAQVDPIGMGAVSLIDPQSLNLYSYVINDPINFVDSDGRFPIAVAIILAGGLVGGAISALNAPKGQRLSAFGKGFVTGAVATSFGVLGAATGTILGAAAVGTVGGFSSSVAGDLYDGKPIDYGAATRSAILNGAFTGLGSFVAGAYYPIANNQFRIIYENRPFLQNLWALSRWRPISWWGPNSIRTAVQESSGVLIGSATQQLVTNLTYSPAPTSGPPSLQPAGGASITTGMNADKSGLPNLGGGLGGGMVSPPRIRSGIGWNPFVLLDLYFASWNKGGGSGGGGGGGGGGGVSCYFNDVWQPCILPKNKN